MREHQPLIGVEWCHQTPDADVFGQEHFREGRAGQGTIGEL